MVQIEFKGSPFIGEKTALRPVELADLDEIMKWFNTYETRRFLLAFLPYSRAQEEEWIKTTITAANERTEFTFAITSKSRDDFLGTCSIRQFNWFNRSGVVGIAIHNPANHDKGFGSDALLCLLKFGFRILNLHRIEISVFEFNERAKHVYEKIGFTEIGRKRKAIFFEGTYYDEIVLDFLSDEFFSRYP
nr:GNAT family N-acetyltransferase [Candidatus Sigynarchaeota archaeon]